MSVKASINDKIRITGAESIHQGETAVVRRLTEDSVWASGDDRILFEVFDGSYEIITNEEDGNMNGEKAQVGDLIRIVNAELNGTRYNNGDILIVVEVEEGWGGVDVTLTDENGDYVHVFHKEYVIHRKAGEEDSPKQTRDRFREAQLQIVEGKTPEEAVAISMAELRAEDAEPSKWSDTQPNLIRLAGEELTELLVRKNHDYGDSFSQQYEKYGLTSALIRMDDKMRRLETLSQADEQAQVSESLSDTLLDLAGYALLAYVEQSKK